MKFKGVTNREAPQELVDALNLLRDRLEVEVLEDCFQIKPGTFGPAEFYVQETDFAHGHRPFINYNLSGITLREGRNFERALEVLSSILSELLAEHWPEAPKVQILIVIAVSSGDGRVSKLIESEAFEIDLAE
ncbi:MAG TPA: hypothetical protein VJB82_03010 [Candidatus Peribacterales bacterium]|nr:hypothetical protein [Candidatus Peribacterales bacterium]